MAFVERPLSGTFIALSIVFFLLPLLKYIKKPKTRAGAVHEPAE